MPAAAVVRLLWLALVVSALAAFAWTTRRRRLAALTHRLRTQWGRPRERERDLPAIASWHTSRAAAAGSIDDRTWDDLYLDAVFAILDRTESAVGQQALYHRLRSAADVTTIDAFEALVTAVGEDAPARERAQAALSGLGDPASHDLWRLTRPDMLETAPWHALFPVLGIAMAAALVAVPVWPPALLLIGAGAIASIVMRAMVASHLRVVVGPFRQIGPLIAAATAAAAIECPGAQAIVGSLRHDVANLSGLRRIASWVSRQTAGSFDLASVLFEYLNMLLFLDANALFFGARELKARAPELLRVIGAVGEIDAAIAVASYRSSATGWTRPLRAPDGGRVVFQGIRHPLLADAVPNTAVIEPPCGLIVTGSNMSGKSTFLRTVGVTAVMAQTLNTCLADVYEAPVFVVQSCIGRADDPASGKSYYLVEVDSVLATVHASASDAAHLFLFDELFRGTNAVERIAAGEAVLRALLAPRADGRPAPHVVLAATHDQELVELVSGVYAPFHFTDAVGEAGLAFDYQLRPGPATSRNAIALLRLRGAPADLVARALARAEALDRSRPQAART